MSTKTEILYDKIYTKFITGQYDSPRIPNDADVEQLVEKLNTDNSEPLMKLDDFNVLNFTNLNKVFSAMVDDFDLLYAAVDKQSQNIFDQLSNSLKEYRGIKLTLKRLKSEADDINNGKTDLDNIRYVYTESFTNTNNINIDMSTIDSDTTYPVIDINAGTMYIPADELNVIDFNHYYGRKLNIMPTNYAGAILNTRYIGEADVAVMLNHKNDNRLEYELKTSDPTALHLSFVLQLTSSGKAVDVNGVAISLDSATTNGFIQIEYKTNTGWEGLKDIPTKPITADDNNFSFNTVSTSHIKFTFIKEFPDEIESNIYYLTLNNLSVFKSKNSKTSTLISKSTEIKPYSTEDPVIGTIAAEITGHIPENCYADVYVATDKIIKAYYVDKNGAYVKPDSLNKFKLVTATDDTHSSRYVLLSDVIGRSNISGVSEYNHLNYDWQLLKSFETDDMKPELINFVNLNKKDPFDNAISNMRSYLYGDSYYKSNLSGAYPQNDGRESHRDWFMSGVINEDNPSWDPYMSGLVDQDPMLYGADYGHIDSISGFPFNWYNKTRKREFRFNDFISLVPGWYRPESNTVEPTITIPDVENPFPDFYINGIKFYKVYRFEANSEVIASDINIFTYQTKPVNGSVTNDVHDYYPHNMVWQYNDKHIPYRQFQHNYPTINGEVGSTVGSGLIKLVMPSGAVYIPDSVSDVHYYKENLYLDRGRQWNVTESSGNVYVNFAALSNDADVYQPYSELAFNYAYNDVNKYASYWKGYIIADDNDIKVTLKQDQLGGVNIVNKYKIVNTETGEAITKNDSDSNKNYNILDDNEKTITLDRGIYEFNVHCLTDIDGSTPANWWSPNSSDFIQVIGNARIVAEIDPLKVVSLETLLFTTTYENDFRCAVITDTDSLKYVIVKEPSKNLIPGYYFNNTTSAYRKNDDHLIKNIGHYKRKWLNPSGVNIAEEYITGSYNSTIMSGNYDDTPISGSISGVMISGIDLYNTDYKWNKGDIYPQEFSNTDSDTLYRVHSTFNNPINVDDDFDSSINKGHLFYDTGENLAAFYTMQYGEVNRDNTTINKFLYKVVLTSEDENLSPILDSIKFTMNTNLEEL